MYKKYEKEGNLSFTFGAFVTFELLNKMPEKAKAIILKDKVNFNDDIQRLIKLAQNNNLEIIYNTKLVEKLSGKENCYVIGVFEKFSKQLDDKNHVVLVNPSDMGNLGTIMRTMLGFGVKNLAIIKPCADVFSPKVVRASMGAIFSLNIQTFDIFEDYEKSFSRNYYTFMLNGKENLRNVSKSNQPYSLIFGNEAHGLGDEFLKYNSVVIKHSNEIDSLNLPISVAMAIFHFESKKF